MANNKNNAGASLYYYGKNHIQGTDKEVNTKTVAIVSAVFIIVVVLLRLLCVWVHKDNDDDDVVAGAGNIVRQRRQNRETGGWANREPSPMVAGGADVEVVSPVRAAEPLVCTYRKADGWQDSSCGVCLADLADGDVLRVLPVCMHCFHAACIGEWLRRHDTCPLCRAPHVAPAASA